MRQPALQFGDKVDCVVPMRHESGYEELISVRGTVVGIYYDPADGTKGHPFYIYNVQFDNKHRAYNLAERYLTKVQED